METGGVGTELTLLPAEGDDPALILAWSSFYVEDGDIAGWTTVIPGNIPRGEHRLDEVWDQTSRIDMQYIWGMVVDAGDVNDDGHRDVWFEEQLFMGPLLGRSQDASDAHASLDNEVAVAGNLDLDGDGHLDVIVQRGSGNQAFIYYGPFDGDLPPASAGKADPATYTSLGENRGCLDVNASARVLRDHAGPGQHVVAVGYDLGGCTYDVYVWDPHQPPGTHLTYDDAIAVLSHPDFQFWDYSVFDPGDVDQDGHNDLLWDYQSHAQLIAGPLEGLYWTREDLGFYDQVVNGRPVRSMGDVNGDGRREILGKWVWPDEEDIYNRTYTWVLMCSPFDLPMDMATGVPLITVEGWGGSSVAQFIGMDSVDLDGDGLHDLINAGLPNGGGFDIWYGSDLAAACAASDQHASPPTPTIP